jgi:hypothetical protein
MTRSNQGTDHAWLVMMKAMRALTEYATAGIEETTGCDICSCSEFMSPDKWRDQEVRKSHRSARKGIAAASSIEVSKDAEVVPIFFITKNSGSMRS